MILFKEVKKLKLVFMPKRKKDRLKVIIILNNNSKNFSNNLEKSIQHYYLISQVKPL
jgi:hypothetical protein